MQPSPSLAAPLGIIFSLSLGLLSALTTPALSRDSAVFDLRCEYLANPLGIDSDRPRFSWKLAPSEGRGLHQTAYRVLVATSPKLLQQEQPDLWDSGRVESSASIHVVYGGKPLASRQKCYWKAQVWTTEPLPAAWSSTQNFSVGFLRPEEWQASWIQAESNTGGKTQVGSGPLPLFRKTFRVEKKVRRAELAICGLGFYEASLNSRALQHAELEPGWTDYRKTSLYRVLNVTDALHAGENVLGVALGNGMYHVAGGRYTKFTGSFGPPKLIARLDLEYADGTSDRVLSDQTWKTAPGPITFSCIFGGEDYDARNEVPGWDSPGFDTTAWHSAVECEGPGGKLQSDPGAPIQVRERFAVARILQPRPNVWVYDLGQNFSGWPALDVSGARGATVKLIPGELLDSNNLVSQASSGGPVWFSYTLKGTGTERWRPRFSYSGFRYLQVEGAVPAHRAPEDQSLPRLHRLEGEFLYPATAVHGHFQCSNEQVNGVHQLILAAIKSNYKSVLTDCPHREKLGWLECSHLLAGCFMYNFDCARFYAKIATDMRDAQLPNGLVPDIAPEYVVFDGGFRDSPEWGSAAVISPWRAYQMYGDRRTLEEQYPAMLRYVDYLATRAQDHIVSHGLGDWYDIGPKGPGPSQLTSLGLTATGVYLQNLRILEQVATLLGRPAEAERHAQRAGEVAAALNRKFFDAERGAYDRGSQTANAMPLVLGAVPEAHRPAVLASLVQNIRAGGNRVTAGDVGFYYVVQALLNGGRSDVLYDMLCQTNGPGYLYQLAKGATSLTEAWDTNPASSQNHCMLGHIEEWLYSGLLGIRPAVPGFQEFVIQPQVVGDLSSAEGSYESPFGRIATAWQRDGARLRLNLEVPPNTRAVVHVPTTQPADVRESGKPAYQAPGVTFMRIEGNAALYRVGSGRYQFDATF